MKIAFAWCVLGFLALSNVTISRAEGSSADIEKAIAALEKQWAQAETANNADLIAPLLADKFIITESEGKVIDRAGFLAEERSNHYSSSEIDESQNQGVRRHRYCQLRFTPEVYFQGESVRHTHTRDRHVGEGAERRLAMRCRTWVYNQKDLGPSGSGKSRLPLRRLFPLVIDANRRHRATIGCYTASVT